MNEMSNVVSARGKIHYQGQVPNLNYVSGRSKPSITDGSKFARGREVHLARHIPGNGARWMLMFRPFLARAPKISNSRLIKLMVDLQNKKADWRVRSKAAEELGKTCSAKNAPSVCKNMVVPLLIAGLKDKDQDVRVKAAEALGKIGDVRAVRPLLELMNLASGDILTDFFSASSAITKLNNVLPSLISVVRGKDITIRDNAIFVLGELCGKKGAPAQCRKTVVPLLIMKLRDKDFGVRESAARALGKIKDRRAVPYLIWLLRRDRVADVRNAAAEALGEIGDKKAVPPLIFALKDKDVSVRAYAAGALGDIGDKRAVPPLIVALKKDRDKWVRSSAADALGEIGDKRAVRALTAALKDGDAGVRKAAKAALRKINPVKTSKPPKQFNPFGSSDSQP